jgi:hypothetical protein
MHQLTSSLTLISIFRSIFACNQAVADRLQFRILSESGQTIHSAVRSASSPEDKLVMSEPELNSLAEMILSS